MPDEEVKKPGPQPKVSLEQFNALETKVNDGFSAIMNKLDGMGSSIINAIPTPKIEAAPDVQSPVPPAWRQLVTEILGEDFDVELTLPEAGGSIFKIIVPKDKSNASQMHWTMFKRDVRSKELGNTGAKGVKECCLLVRKNLINSGTKLPVYP